MKRFSFSLALAASVMLLILSCNTKSDNTNPQQGLFLVANISPDATPLNVYINSTTLGTGLGYGVYTPYYGVTAGTYSFAFTDASNSQVLTNTVNIAATKKYTYFLVDSFKAIKASFVEDNFVTPPSDSVYIRFFNLSPNAGPVKLIDSVSKAILYTRNFNDQSSNSSYTNYDRVKAGVYNFQLTNIYDSILTSRVDTLSGGHVYTIFARGFYAGTGTQALGLGQINNY
jgi:hypothetical protein